MCMKIKIVTENRGVEAVFLSVEKKELNTSCRTEGKKPGGNKNAGKSHDLDENKGRGKRQKGKSHDVDENKMGYSFEATMCMKNKVVTEIQVEDSRTHFEPGGDPRSSDRARVAGTARGAASSLTRHLAAQSRRYENLNGGVKPPLRQCGQKTGPPPGLHSPCASCGMVVH